MRGEGRVNDVRTQRIKWWGHLKSMVKTKTVSKITKWDPITGSKYVELQT
jgi:hypothetical protein